MGRVGETVTAEVKWVSPAHYVEVRAQVATPLRRELDEVKHERDAVYSALVRHVGREYAASLLRRARRRFQKRSTSGLAGAGGP